MPCTLVRLVQFSKVFVALTTTILVYHSHFSLSTGFLTFFKSYFHQPRYTHSPYGIRTRVTAVKRRCLNPLTNGPELFQLFLLYPLLESCQLVFKKISWQNSRFTSRWVTEITIQQFDSSLLLLLYHYQRTRLIEKPYYRLFFITFKKTFKKIKFFGKKCWQ